MAERCSTKGCRCMVVKDGLCRTCLAGETWKEPIPEPESGLPRALRWVDLDLLETLDPDDTRWLPEGACYRQGNTGIFYIEQGGDPKPGKAMCLDCPVVHNCLAVAVFTQTSAVDHGTWGNTTPRERRKIRRALATRRARRELLEQAS